MPQPALTLGADFEIDFVGVNLDALGVEPVTRDAIEQAEPRGTVVYLGGGVPALAVNGTVLGAPLDDDRLRQSVATLPRDAVVVVHGLGVGHAARVVRAEGVATVVVYEPDPGVARLVLSRGPTDLGDALLVTSLHDLGQLWGRLARRGMSATLVRSQGYAEAYPEQDRLLASTLRELVTRVGINGVTHRQRGRTWVRDVLANVDVLASCPPATALAGQLEGVPAFIVGAGPSLAKNVALLREASRKGVVLATNSSARALARAGVEPQVLGCMESIDVSHLFADVPFIDRVARCFSLTAAPATFRTGQGPALPLFEAMPEIGGPLAELVGHPGLTVCGSVSTILFALAQRMGCSPIVFVGQDLAYTDGLAYAAGTVYEGSRAAVCDETGTVRLLASEVLERAHDRAQGGVTLAEPLDRALAWGGDGEVPSTAQFSAVRAWLEGAAQVMARELPDQRLINATEGGARIAGFAEARLRDVVAGLPDLGLDAAELDRRARAVYPPLGHERLRYWAEAERAATHAISRRARHLRRLVEHATRAMKGDHAERVSRAFRAIERAERELTQAVQAAPLVDAYTYALVDDLLSQHAERPASGDARADAERSLALEHELATLLEREASALCDELDLVVQRQISSLDVPTLRPPGDECAPPRPSLSVLEAV